MVLGECARYRRALWWYVTPSIGRYWPWSKDDLLIGAMDTGFMTFAPEWLSGSRNLDTSNFMYMWVYLFFFNMLWVVIPLWVLYEAYHEIYLAFARASGAIGREIKKEL